MNKIIVKGLCDDASNPQFIHADGADYPDDLAQYFPDDLLNKGISRGYMELKWENDKLYVIVEYQSENLLSDIDLKLLKEYTSGQLSDGAGENFECEPCAYDENGDEIYVSPWYRGQILDINQYPI